MSETAAKDSEWVWPSAVPSPATSAQKSASPPPGATEAASKSSSASPAPVPTPGTTATPAPLPNNRSVLIVEDDRSARRAIAMILRRRGYAVFEAATVADALAWLADQPPQWMLLDLMLPDGCGIDVLRKVQADQMATRTCIITGCAAAMINKAREAGAEHTFVKPLDVERLVTVMDAD